MIDHRIPNNWRALQEKVAEIFRDIGYLAETDKKLGTIRGSVNVDVFSADITQSPNMIYVCECKHWSRRVPKTVVHSFRTVMQDFGANYGLIISKKGFQKGAYEAAQNTNIKLVDWFDFQKMFEAKWLPAISERVYDKCEMLISYTEPILGTSLVRKLDKIKSNREKKIAQFKKLRQKYEVVGMTILHLRFANFFRKNSQVIKLPVTLNIPKEKGDGCEAVEFFCLRNLLDCLLFWGEKGLKEFAEVFGETA